MAAPRSTRVTRSSVGINGLDENFCGRTLRNRSIAQPEESLPVALPRARSPKKKQDGPQQQQQQQQQQPPSKGGHPGRQVPEEPWLSPRKRVLSCSEKDCPEKSERAGREASPVLKRAKRCSRSSETPGSEEDSPGKAERTVPVPVEAGEGNEDPPAPKPVGCVPPPDDGGEKTDSLAEGCDQPVPPNEAHKVTNGLDGGRLADAEAPPDNAEPDSGGPCAPPEECQAVPVARTNSNEALLNGSQADSVPPPSDPHVPCKNSQPKQAEPGCPETAAETDPAIPTPSSGTQPPAREPEEEVDVVGDAPCPPQERAPESTNGGLCAVQDSPPISGEAEPPAPPTPTQTPGSPPAEPPSFTEPQEHRYTLRTSPRRPACSGKGSPSKPHSPSTDNGPPKVEDGEGEEVQAEAAPTPDEPPSSGLGLSNEPVTECSEEGEVKAGGESGALESSVSKSTKETAGSQMAEEEEDEEDPDVYYFESDHLALKHNKDYQRLLQTISVLEAQRTQAILDLETLARHQREALRDPIGFVEQLQKQVAMGLPCPQRVVQLPDIAWDQYTSGLGDFKREFHDKKRNTRRLKLIFDKVGLPTRPKSPLDSRKEGESSSLYSALPSSDAPEHSASSSRTQMIRGRICDQNKPDTFNQLWTVEEQKKLEQLLLKFPPEEVESKRWQKIADELGNRTAKQVASRVQKYFIKLTKAGIPVPGRTPNLCMYSKKASSKRQHHLNKHLYRPSTFLTSYEPPVYMDDEDDRSSFYSGLQDPAAEDSDEDGIPVEYRNLPEYKELVELKKLKKQKIQEIQAESTLAQHVGYKCDGCGTEPIQGTRWHCRDCPQDVAVDFCSNCSDCLFKTETHKPDHRLEPVYQADTFLDRDYCLPQSTGYNYLDPNYFPANR
ncbi:ZZ-type zinc finger-containing protein 3 [Megalops cyprinoides]|uniref:ZZ-type zinc finger-containing protein 3 n=1 Tax=Megalops cyprinoides TaxID=118141 RepID=UPI0018645CC8|nr:ZZ-type zinc finger-containing protein 3 [Megalops cyprinoides]